VPLAFVRPCNATGAKLAPAGGAWLHEPKLDGYRLQVIKAGGHCGAHSASSALASAKLSLNRSGLHLASEQYRSRARC
jgi:hypothetical protein